jgi:hypothetical protein
METKSIAKINNVRIVMIDNGQKLVPIKPICEALGIAYEPQFQKLKDDEFLNSTITLSVTVGADKKVREMVCLPYRFVFGWLFTINPKNVNHEAKDAVARYRIECYEALFRHFTDQEEFLRQKQEVIEAHLDKVEQIRQNFKATKLALAEATDQLNAARSLTIEQWKDNNRQLKLPFDE